MNLKIAILLIAVISISGSISESNYEDLQVWQGQYFMGTEFMKGTYDFNFTIYDAYSGGTPCYSNTTKIKTGNWGEWITEQHSVGYFCNNSSKSYWLNIAINGLNQTPRKKLTAFNYLRKDVSDTMNNMLTVLGGINILSISGEDNIVIDGRTYSRNMTKGVFRFEHTPIIDGTRAITFDIDANGMSNTSAMVIEYKSNGTNANNTMKLIDTVIDTNNSAGSNIHGFKISKSGSGTANITAVVVYPGINPIIHKIDNETFSWDKNGDLFMRNIYAANLTANYFIGNGSLLIGLPSAKIYSHLSNFTNDMSFINSTQAQYFNETDLIIGINNTLENKKVSYTDATDNLNLGNLNITANYAFFSFLGSLFSRATKLWVVDINATGNIETSQNVSANYFIGNGSLLTNVKNMQSVKKTSDQTKNNDSVLDDDNELKFSVAPNSIYWFKAFIVFNTSATPDIKYTMQSANATINSVAYRSYRKNAGTTFSDGTLQLSFGNSESLTATATGTGFIDINGYFSVGNSGGNVSFQWAQANSNAANTIVLTGSYIIYG